MVLHQPTIEYWVRVIQTEESETASRMIYKSFLAKLEKTPTKIQSNRESVFKLWERRVKW